MDCLTNGQGQWVWFPVALFCTLALCTKLTQLLHFSIFSIFTKNYKGEDYFNGYLLSNEVNKNYNYKTPKRKHRRKSYDGARQDFLENLKDITQKKNHKLNVTKIYNFCSLKVWPLKKEKEEEKASYRLGENICKIHIKIHCAQNTWRTLTTLGLQTPKRK